MALKKRITKEQHEALNEAFKGEYKADGDNFVLDIDGDEDTGALRRAKDREAQKARDAEAKANELQQQLDALSTDDARKTGDIKTLDKSWQTKLDTQKTDFEAKINVLTGHISKSLVDNVAMQIAHKISTAPKVLIPHIKSRLKADFDGDVPVTRVLDKDGKPSALTVDELANEFVADKDFSGIITASKATGGAGKSNQLSNGGAGANNNDSPPPDLSKMPPSELAARIKAQKAENAND